jgi:hypothetical protein
MGMLVGLPDGSSKALSTIEVVDNQGCISTSMTVYTPKPAPSNSRDIISFSPLPQLAPPKVMLTLLIIAFFPDQQKPLPFTSFISGHYVHCIMECLESRFHFVSGYRMNSGMESSETCFIYALFSARVSFPTLALTLRHACSILVYVYMISGILSLV